MVESPTNVHFFSFIFGKAVSSCDDPILVDESSAAVMVKRVVERLHLDVHLNVQHGIVE